MISRNNGSMKNRIDGVNWYSSHTNAMTKHNKSQDESLVQEMIEEREGDPLLGEADEMLKADRAAEGVSDPGAAQSPPARAEAENRITEILEDLYSSLNLRQNTEDILAVAELANRDSKAAKERAAELEQLLAETEETLEEEVAAREAAELQVKEINEEIERMRTEREHAQSSLENEKRAKEETLTISKEIEAWSQEIGVKWLEEADARQAAERRIAEIEAELKRVQSVIGESEAAWDGFDARIQKEAEERALLERKREAAENRETLALRAKAEAEELIQLLESHLQKIDPGFLSDLKNPFPDREKSRTLEPRSLHAGLVGEQASSPPARAQTASSAAPQSTPGFSVGNALIRIKEYSWAFILAVTGAIFGLGYIVYLLLK
jgi:hypothetical protein